MALRVCLTSDLSARPGVGCCKRSQSFDLFNSHVCVELYGQTSVKAAFLFFSEARNVASNMNFIQREISL